MITIANRKELLVTYDMNEQARVRNILTETGIDYTIKTVNLTSPTPLSGASRGRTGGAGVKSESMYEYHIYVKKTEYERASAAICSEK